MALSSRAHHTGYRGPPGEDGLREWRRLLRQAPSRSACGRFFQLAYDLMDGDVGTAQETIKLLAQEEGLSFIRYLAETQIPKENDCYSKLDLWHTELQPLFKLITHPKLLNSAVLESEVATIYNFMQGIGGRRMKTIFDYVAGLPDSSTNSSSAVADTSSLAAIELSLAVLAKMVDCNTTNIVNENVKSVFCQLQSRLDRVHEVPDDFLKLQAQKYSQYIRRRLDVGDDLLGETKYQKPVAHAEFVMRRDLPGHLSAEGPRHDNDHAEISEIRILPTYDEIISPRKEYLPTNDTSLFHLPGIRGRLDREFRLLREDTIGQLRDAVRSQLNASQPPGTNLAGGNKDSLRTYVYQDAIIDDISISRIQGLDFLVRFSQPVSSKEEQKRREWWSHSKRLQPGGLVCLISNGGSVLFCVVADSTIVASNDKRNAQQNTEDSLQATEQRRSPSLADNNKLAYVHLHLAEAVPSNIARALRWYRSVTPAQSWYIVEFPGVLLPSFQYTLEALQKLSKRPDLPFTDLLAPTPGGRNQTEVPPPQYATRRNFSFDLSCLTQGNSTLRCSTSAPLDPQELTRHSILDATQSSALLDTLSRSLALIQGPPGTGKSFTGERIIQVLLANKTSADLGPILCVCYTNHALDQLLEHLHDNGVKGIIRIGSRSKSERLQSVNLRLVAQREDRTKAEKRALWESEKGLDDHVQDMTDLLDQLRTCHSKRALEKYLADRHPKHHDALLGKDEEGFQKVFRRQNRGLKEWKEGGTHDASAPRPIGDLLEADLWAMTNIERVLLHNYWLGDIQSALAASFVKEHQHYAERKGLRDRVLREVDLRCLSQADVVGVTTTGLARSTDLLRKLRLEHAILIGDHLQLRPQIQNYDLQSTNPRGAKYSLDVSLFERLVNPPHENEPRLPFNTLETQRRMHPSIANLVRQTLYPPLIDSDAVKDYPQLPGMKRRLFWLHHEHSEDRASQLDPTTTSHSNTFEVDMIIALVQHLVRQEPTGASLQKTMESANSHVVETIQLAAIAASHLATVNPRVQSVQCLVTIAAVIRDAARNVTSRVRRVPSSNARLTASTASARCRPSICGEICPDAKYCQSCCSDDIRKTGVDFIMGMQYDEINLDEDPCIFPDCGHFITKSNMDGIMDMKAHYHMSEDDNPIAITKASEPFSMNEVKVCPTCRGSLRNIGRYGRIVRRAMLDEATKKFVAWSNSEYLKLADSVVDLQQSLSDSPHPQALSRNTRPAKIALSTGRPKQLHLIRDWVGNDRYSGALSLWHKISAFIGQVRKEEQPFQRVADFVTHAARQRDIQGDFAFDSSHIQVKGYLQASALRLRCETVIFSDFLEVRKELATARPEIKLDFSTHLKDCDALIELAILSKYPRQEVEGHIYLAQFLAFVRVLTAAEAQSTDAVSGEEQANRLRAQATDHLNSARGLVERYPSTKFLEPEIQAVEIMLSDGVFYQKVSGDEMRAVYEAMRREFLGTGHWYTCRNGHPFTVGECGMPMEQARCPECGEAVGGQSHMPAEGVVRRVANEDQSVISDLPNMTELIVDANLNRDPPDMEPTIWGDDTEGTPAQRRRTNRVDSAFSVCHTLNCAEEFKGHTMPPLLLFTVLTAGMTVAHVQGSPLTPLSRIRAGHARLPQLSWNLLPTGSQQQFRGLAPVSGTIAWVSGTNSTVLRTTDGGNTWESVGPELSAEDAALQFRDIQAWSADRAVVLSIGAGAESRIYHTRDGGETWNISFTNQEEAAFYNCMDFEDGNRGIAVSDPVDGKFRLIETLDGGKSWDIVDPSGLPSALVGEFGFSASGTCISTKSGRWYTAAGGVDPGRISSSGDGYGWEVTDTPIKGGPAGGVFSVRFRDANHGIALGGDFEAPTGAVNNAAWSKDGGKTWTAATKFPGGYRSGSSWIPGLCNVALAVGPTGSDYTVDGGKTWHGFYNGSFDSVEFQKL
ncbi:hypothetical protein DL771_001047 [Monosporascus sp. 5C6A]|nr:hypothetical protein DL771_001047 [Monosporascus sp. 5C6A]